jgi:hypothetical protein
MGANSKVAIGMSSPQRLRREPRRSKRLVLSIPVHVFGQDVFLESFNEFANMISVNAHGGSLALAARVEEGQRILVVNKSTGEEQECRVMNVGSLRDGKWMIGIAFVEHIENFWKIHFPASPSKQLDTLHK